MRHHRRGPASSRRLALGVFAYDANRAFEAERLPHRCVDRAGRGLGIGMSVGASVVLLALAVVWLEQSYGRSGSGDPPDWGGFEIFLGALAIMLSTGAAWFLHRRNVLEITREHVRVAERRLFGDEAWVEPLSEYRLLFETSYHSSSDWGADLCSWRILLDHEDPARTVFLRSRTLTVTGDGLEEADGRLTGESLESVTDEFLALSTRWARTLDLPLQRREDHGASYPVSAESPDRGNGSP